MHLSPAGETAARFWHEIPNHFPHVRLDAFVVMPDHIHGILVIDDTAIVETLHATSDNNTKNISDISNQLYDISGSETLHATSLRDNTANIMHPKNEQMSMISPKSGSLSQIIRSYKSAVSKQIHLFNPAFAWQTRFYDRVIRDWDEFRRIAGYVETNPEKWEEKQHSQTNKQL